MALYSNFQNPIYENSRMTDNPGAAEPRYARPLQTV